MNDVVDGVVWASIDLVSPRKLDVFSGALWYCMYDNGTCGQDSHFIESAAECF